MQYEQPKVTVTVTDSDIALGRPCSSERDALNLAIQRSIPPDCKVITGPHQLTFFKKNSSLVQGYYRLPPEIVEWSYTFDRNKALCKPITFTILLPPTWTPPQ